MEYFLYLLENPKGRHYIGSSANPSERLHEHNAGKSKSTRPYRPWKLIYVEKFDSKEEACKKEYRLKHPAGYQEKLNIINTHGEVA